MNRSIRWAGIAKAYAVGLMLPMLPLTLVVLSVILVACTNQPGASGAPGGGATPGASGPGY
jgi:hypothetical protein